MALLPATKKKKKNANNPRNQSELEAKRAMLAKRGKSLTFCLVLFSFKQRNKSYEIL